jgi:glutamate dehydrogenase
LFDENYALASTQALKNKDIPEDGAKGTILPSLGANPRLCFEKYVDVCLHSSRGWCWTSADHTFQAIIDLLIPGQTPGIKEDIVDLYEKPEILFLRP